MTIELSLIAILVLIISGIAVSSMRKIKPNSVEGGVHLSDDFVQKLAKAIGEEFRAAIKEEMKHLPVAAPQRGGFVTSSGEVLDSEIKMDESIIPVAVKTNADLTNLENMAKEVEN